MFALAVLSLVSVAAAIGPCCPPRQWEGTLTITMGTYDTASKTGHFTEGSMLTSFDADRKLVVSRQSLMYDSTPIKQTIINDYNSGVMYIAKEDGTCTATQLDTSLPFCIPDNATQSGVVDFGFGDNTVMANSFEVKFQDYTMYIAVTSDTCVPLTQAVVGQNSQGSVIESLHYSGISAGIADASVFDIPALCTQASVQPPLPGLGKRSAFY